MTLIFYKAYVPPKTFKVYGESEINDPMKKKDQKKAPKMTEIQKKIIENIKSKAKEKIKENQDETSVNEIQKLIEEQLKMEGIGSSKNNKVKKKTFKKLVTDDDGSDLDVETDENGNIIFKLPLPAKKKQIKKPFLPLPEVKEVKEEKTKKKDDNGTNTFKFLDLD